MGHLGFILLFLRYAIIQKWRKCILRTDGDITQFINLPAVFEFAPDIVLYIAGVDTLKEDSLGRLGMSKKGLMERDRMVMSECKRRGIPLSLGLGGGYSKPIEHTVEAYCGPYIVAKEVFG